MADYPGAVAAIKARLAANWLTTPIRYQNENLDPPTDPSTGDPLPWVFLEVLANQSEMRSAGVPGDQLWLYYGHILVHVFVPINDGVELAQQHAAAIGEIFRAKQFYDSQPGCAVRTAYGGVGPYADGGSSDADEGNWFRVTMTCPFEFYYRG